LFRNQIHVCHRSLYATNTSAAVTGCFDWVANLSLAQSGLPGFTLFSGVKSENQLPFRLDFGQSNGWDRYRLRIPAKAEIGGSQFTITYPDYYKGNLTPIRLRCDQKTKKCRSKR